MAQALSIELCFFLFFLLFWTQEAKAQANEAEAIRTEELKSKMINKSKNESR